MNRGDNNLTNAQYHLETAAQLLHMMVGTRDIETAIACTKTAVFLVEKARDQERSKRHLPTRDELIDTSRKGELFK
jgi:hypothetical protein